MRNAKTTSAGILLIVGAVATIVAHLLSGTLTAADLTAVALAIAGSGLIAAQDAQR